MLYFACKTKGDLSKEIGRKDITIRLRLLRLANPAQIMLR